METFATHQILKEKIYNVSVLEKKCVRKLFFSFNLLREKDVICIFILFKKHDFELKFLQRVTLRTLKK